MTVAQVGGDHYDAPAGQQHWDLCELYDVDGLAWSATAYIVRYDRKGTPKQDLEKTRSYLHRMLQAQRGTRRTVPFPALQEFYDANGLAAGKRRLLNLILGSGEEVDILSACSTISVMLAGMED